MLSGCFLAVESSEMVDHFLKSFVIRSYLMSFLLTAELSMGHNIRLIEKRRLI